MDEIKRLEILRPRLEARENRRVDREIAEKAKNRQNPSG